MTEKAPKIILVVEGDADIGCFLLHLLEEEADYQVVLVTDGPQALSLAKTLQPSLFMLNYHLPHMNGIQLYDQLRTLEGLKAVPAIMLSASLPYDEVRVRGIVGLDKPIDINDLLDTIERLIAITQNKVSSP